MLKEALLGITISIFSTLLAFSLDFLHRSPEKLENIEKSSIIISLQILQFSVLRQSPNSSIFFSEFTKWFCCHLKVAKAIIFFFTLLTFIWTGLNTILIDVNVNWFLPPAQRAMSKQGKDVSIQDTEKEKTMQNYLYYHHYVQLFCKSNIPLWIVWNRDLEDYL